MSNYDEYLHRQLSPEEELRAIINLFDINPGWHKDKEAVDYFIEQHPKYRDDILDYRDELFVKEYRRLSGPIETILRPDQIVGNPEFGIF